MLFLRSLVFHIIFVGWTLFWGIALLWVLLLPRAPMVKIITLYFKSLIIIEKTILGLHYEVRGRENLPAGACIIACKHQSTYETLKLHVLFGDVAIILKRELMWIPIWGWYQAKAGMIAIDRGSGSVAMASIVRGAKKVLQQNRPIVIFPQGTRVPPREKRDYKAGVGVIYATHKVPLVPVALNAGLFWPRRAFFIKGGTVIIEILPPIPAGLPRQAAMAQIEQAIETASDRLCLEVEQNA